jgi:hypothetical protein
MTSVGRARAAGWFWFCAGGDGVGRKARRRFRPAPTSFSGIGLAPVYVPPPLVELPPPGYCDAKEAEQPVCGEAAGGASGD